MVNPGTQQTLNTTEIYPPEYKEHIEPQSFKNQLAQVQRHKLTVIQAAPGYGKTVYLASIFHKVKKTAVWVSIRESDNNPVNFIFKLIEAIKLADDSLNTAFINQVGSIPSPSLYPLVNSLVGELNKSHIGFILFNDIDVLVDPFSVEIVNQLLSATQPSINFAFTCCAQPEISMADLSMQGKVKRIEQETLRFTAIDTKALFHAKGVNGLEEGLLQRLADMTEGWPSAIQFASSVVKNREDLLELIEDISSGDLTIESYFTERVYRNQPKEIQDFMLAVSLIDRFNASLCNEITANEKACSMLNGLVESNIFIAAIDRSRHWFRFHQLFQKFLKKKCMYSLTSEKQNEIAVRAAHWFYRHGFFSDAIELLIRAAEIDLASEWVIDSFIEVAKRQGKHETYLEWIERLPPQQLEKYPKLRMNYLMVLCLTKRYESCKAQIAVLEESRASYDPDTQAEVERVTGVVLFMMAGLLDDNEGLYTSACNWIERWGSSDLYPDRNEYHFDIGMVYMLKGFSCKCLCLFDEGKEAFFKSAEHFNAYGSDFAMAWCRALTAVLYAKQGLHHEALVEATEGLNRAKKTLGEQSHPGFMLAALIAAIHYEYDELETAEHFIADGISYIKEQSSTDMLIASYLTQARLCFAGKEIEKGIAIIKDGLKWADSNNLERLKFSLLNELIVCLARNERLHEAEDYARYYGINNLTSAELDVDTRANRIVSGGVIRILMSHNKYDDAATLLEKLINRSRQTQNAHELAERLKLMAIARFKLEDLKGASMYMIESLEISRTRSYRRIYIDDGVILVPVLLHVYGELKQGPLVAFVKGLLDKLERSGATQKAYWEPLTGREIEIMGLLSTGQLNKQIAAQIFISEGTLKWHLHNIYSKLEVKNRTQAIKVAQQRGYL